MPKKQMHLTDVERAERIREAAQKVGANDAKAFERAFKKIVPVKGRPPSAGTPKSRKTIGHDR